RPARPGRGRRGGLSPRAAGPAPASVRPTATADGTAGTATTADGMTGTATTAGATSVPSVTGRRPVTRAPSAGAPGAVAVPRRAGTSPDHPGVPGIQQAGRAAAKWRQPGQVRHFWHNLP